MNVLIYCRISTPKQDLTSQINSLNRICLDKKWNVRYILSDIASGKTIDRSGFVEMIRMIKLGDIDKIVYTELSRISRDRTIIEKFVKSCKYRGVEIWTNSQGCDVSDMNLDSLYDFYANEITTLRERTNRGYQEYLKRGGKVGRKEGFSKLKELILEENGEVVDLLYSVYSVRQIMKFTDKSSGTIMKIRDILGMVNKDDKKLIS
jgi:DNA invertase Pin-like site-specific DNA recombinase